MTIAERLNKELDRLEGHVSELERENDLLRNSLPWTEHVDRDEDLEPKLPVPRLELLWEKAESRGYNWKATQYLVYKHLLGHFVFVPLGSTLTTLNGEPIDDGVIHLPFRDGAHIQHNAGELGLPAFARVGELVQKLEPRGKR